MHSSRMRTGRALTISGCIPEEFLGGKKLKKKEKNFWRPPKNLETPWKIGDPPKIWRPPKNLETPPQNWRPPTEKLETPLKN